MEKMKYEKPSFVDMNPPMKIVHGETPEACQVGGMPDTPQCQVGSGFVHVLCCNQGSSAGRICLSGSHQEF